VASSRQAILGRASNTLVLVDDATHVSLIASSVPGTYVLVGLSPGATTLHAAAGDADPTTLPVTVIAQTAARPALGDADRPVGGRVIGWRAGRGGRP
jgi:hypothetical protein